MRTVSQAGISSLIVAIPLLLAPEGAFADEPRPDYSGQWQMLMPAGWIHPTTLEVVGEGRYRLTAGKTRFNGVYTRRDDTFVAVEPLETEREGYRWKIRSKYLIRLVDQSGEVKGSDYRGTILFRPNPTESEESRGGATDADDAGGGSVEPVVAPIAYGEKQKVAVRGLIKKLASPSQKRRDVAAKKLRELYVPPECDKWEAMLAVIAAGDTKQKIKRIMRRFGVDSTEPMLGAGTGQVHMEEYRLDDRWVLSGWFNNADDTLREAELEERLRHVWIAPPDDFTGVWIIYHVNGERSHRIEYRDGEYFGTFVTFHPNGQKSVVQHYGPKGISGADTGYFPTGEVMYTAYYKDGAPVGTWTWYNKDGSVRTTRRQETVTRNRPQRDAKTEKPRSVSVVDLSGQWLMTLPAGFEHWVHIESRDRNRYRLAMPGKNNLEGVYELRELGDGRSLAVVEPDDKRMTRLTWELLNANALLLVKPEGATPACAS